MPHFNPKKLLGVLVIVFACIAFTSFSPLHAFAQSMGPSSGMSTTGPSSSGAGLTNPLGSTTDLMALLTAILTFITTKIGPVIVTLMLVYCGFLFVTARGNEESIRTARAALLWTVIGALILLGATAIQSVITATIGTL